MEFKKLELKIERRKFRNRNKDTGKGDEFSSSRGGN